MIDKVWLLENKVLLDPITIGRKSVILTIETSTPNTARVIKVGPGKENHPLTVKEGDLIIYSKSDATEIQIQSKKYLVASEDTILCILED